MRDVVTANRNKAPQAARRPSAGGEGEAASRRRRATGCTWRGRRGGACSPANKRKRGQRALAMWLRPVGRAVAAVAGVLLGASSAWASGLESGTNGSQSMSRGGAFVAKADDPSAVEHNPAGLGRMRGFRLTFDNNIMFSGMSFQRDGAYFTCPGPDSTACVKSPYAGQAYPKVSDEYGPSWIPQIAATYGFGRVGIGFGLFGPSSARGVQYPSTVTTASGVQAPAPSRYDLVGSDLFVVFPTLAVGVQATDWLHAGVSLHYAYSNLKFHQTVATPKTACGSLPSPMAGGPDYGGGDESPVCDVDVKVDATDTMEFSATAGVLVTPTPNWEFGATVRLPTDIHATGKTQLTAFLDGPTAVLNPEIPPNLSPADMARAVADAECPGGMAEKMRLQTLGQKCVQGTMTIITGLPWKARLGGRYVFRSGGEEVGDIELDFAYDRWSSFKNIDTQIRGIAPAPEPTIHIPHHYKDTFGTRLGGAKRFDLANKGLEVRGGLSYESSATADQYTKLDFAAWDKIGLHAGLGYDLWKSESGSRATLQIGYGLIYMPERKETDSNTAQTNALFNGTDPANPDPPVKDPRTAVVTIVGNGTYTNTYHVLNAGLGLAF